MSAYALIPALPLAAFLFLALGGRRLGEAGIHRVGIFSVGTAFALSLAAFAGVARDGLIEIPLYRLIEAGGLVVDAGLYIDQLAVLLLPLVTGVSFIVHVYSSRYMTGDPRYRRFFAVMALFTAAMAMLVMSDNLLVTYMCWEVMGICSYLLISHWAARPAAGRAATKAFLVNAVADVGLGFGVVLAFATYGTLDIPELLERAAAMDGRTLAFLGLEIERNTLIALCLLSGAMGKSAQVPMHVWLPHAMEAPTPVSALIHAATMVNAGPFLLVRLAPLVILSPPAMGAIAAVGAVTALYGALVSLTQSDIKKLLAYSTVSQIGFMIFTCGVGAFGAAIFHLLAHGFLKGFLFLSTGDALNAASGHGHGGPAGRPARVVGLAMGALPLACVAAVVLFAGPYERIWVAQPFPSARAAFWCVALATVFFTAAYVFRGIVSLFGQSVGEGVSARPRLLSIAHLPGLALAGAAIGALLLGAWSAFSGFLAPVTGSAAGEPRPTDLPLSLAAALATAVAGWGWAWYRHAKPPAVPLAARPWARTAYVLLLNKLYFDELHEALAVNPVLRLSRWLWLRVEGIGEGTAHGAAKATVRGAGWLWSGLDQPATDSALRGFDRAAEGTGNALERAGPRTLRHHLAIIVCIMAAAIGWGYFLAG